MDMRHDCKRFLLIFQLSGAMAFYFSRILPELCFHAVDVLDKLRGGTSLGAP